jgi:hypothetical protein
VDLRVFDIVDDLIKHPTLRYKKRDLSKLEAHVVHHTTGPRNLTPDRIARDHVNSRGWPGIGYTLFITADGNIYLTNHLDTMSYATGGQNHRYLSTCLAGNFMEGQQPTPAQISSLRWLHHEWIPAKLNLSAPLPLLGHQEGAGQSTACPGDSWNWHTAIE